MSCGVKTLNFEIPYYKNEGCYRTENLQKEMYLGCSMTKASWKLRGSAIFNFRIYMMSRENKESIQLFVHLSVARVCLETAFDQENKSYIACLDLRVHIIDFIFRLPSIFSIGSKDCVTSKKLNPYGHPGSNYDINTQRTQCIQRVKFMPNMFPFFLIAIFPLPLVLNSWSKVQFWEKSQLSLTFSSPIDVLTLSWTFWVRNSILPRSKTTQGLVFEIGIWASALLVWLYFVSYLIRSPRFIPGLQSSFYTRSAVRVLYLFNVLYPVRSPGPAFRSTQSSFYTYRFSVYL